MDDETVGKIADATKEVAKTTGLGLELVRAAGGFLNRLLGESLSELGLAGADRIRTWRLTNLIASAAKAKDKADALGLGEALRALPVSDSTRWIEGAASEEEPEIQDLWAQLLVNAADPNVATRIDKVIAGILRELTPLDARILEHLQRQGWALFPDISGGFGVMRLSKDLSVTDSDVWTSVGNLLRMGCLVQQEVTGGGPPGAKRTLAIGAVNDATSTYRPSPLANALWKAVSPKGSR